MQAQVFTEKFACQGLFWKEIFVQCSVFWALDCNPDTLLSIRPFTCHGTDVIAREGKKLGRRCTAYLGYLGVGLSGVTFEKVME